MLLTVEIRVACLKAAKDKLNCSTTDWLLVGFLICLVA